MTVHTRILCKGTFVRGVAIATFSLLAQGAFAVTVNCGVGETISSALAPGAVIEIKGLCKENVVITQDDVTLKRAPGSAKPKLRSKSKANKSAIVIDGARRVALSGLKIVNSLNGIVATNGATFTLGNSTVKNNKEHGVVISNNASGEIKNSIVKFNGLAGVMARGALVTLQDNRIRLNDEYGVLLVDGANAQIRAGNTIEEGSIAAIGAFRGISLRVRGDNVIGKEAGDGVSLSLFHSVDFRQDDGHTIYNGSMEFGNLTNASLRDPEIKGSVEIFHGSVVDIRKSSIDGLKELTGGDIEVSGLSKLSFFRGGTTVEAGRILVFNGSQLGFFESGSTVSASDMTIGNGSVVQFDSNMELTVSDIIDINTNSQLQVHGEFTTIKAGSVQLFAGSGLGLFFSDPTLTVVKDLLISNKSSVNVSGANAIITAATIQMFATSDLSVFGSGYNLNVTDGIEFGTNSHMNFTGDNSTINGDIRFSRRSSLDVFGPSGPANGTTIRGNVTMFDFGGGNSDANLEQVIIDGGTIDCGFGFRNVLGGIPVLINGASVVNC